MLYLTCTTITSVDLAHDGVSRVKDWVSGDCGTRSIRVEVYFDPRRSWLCMKGLWIIAERVLREICINVPFYYSFFYSGASVALSRSQFTLPQKKKNPSHMMLNGQFCHKIEVVNFISRS